MSESEFIFSDLTSFFSSAVIIESLVLIARSNPISRTERTPDAPANHSNQFRSSSLSSDCVTS